MRFRVNMSSNILAFYLFCYLYICMYLSLHIIISECLSVRSSCNQLWLTDFFYELLESPNDAIQITPIVDFY